MVSCMMVLASFLQGSQMFVGELGMPNTKPGWVITESNNSVYTWMTSTTKIGNHTRKQTVWILIAPNKNGFSNTMQLDSSCMDGTKKLNVYYSEETDSDF